MTIKFSRESALIIFAILMILVGIFYLGNIYFVQPAKEEAELLNDMVKANQNLLENYPASEALLEEYRENSLTTRLFLPIGDQANSALIILERLAENFQIDLVSVNRESFLEAVEGVPPEFVKNSYSVEVKGDSPSAFRQLIKSLMQEDRVWNVYSLSYSKGKDQSFKGNFDVEIYFFEPGGSGEAE